MTSLVQELLNNFDQLTNSEQIDLAIEILKRTSHLELPALSDDSLAINAEGIFLALDKQEAENE